jgi:peptidoglycan/LPS O-acetylase OafA/YrhL
MWVSVLRSKALTSLGTVAYCVYIFHPGVNALAHIGAFGRLPVIDSWASAGVTLASLVFVLMLSAVSWRYMERPLIRLAHSRHKYFARENQAAVGITAVSAAPVTP